MDATQSLKRNRGSIRRGSAAAPDDKSSDKSKANVVTPKGPPKDCRTTEQRVLDSYCTFQPVTNNSKRKGVEGSPSKSSNVESVNLGNGIGSMALDDSTTQVDPTAFGENLIDVYKENPYDAIVGRNTGENANAPIAFENSMLKSVVDKRVKNDLKAQAGIDKCLAHLRRGKEKREQDNQVNKSLEMRYYDQSPSEKSKTSSNSREDGLDSLGKNDFQFATDTRNNSKGRKGSVKTYHNVPERGSQAESIASSTDPPTVQWVQSLRTAPVQKKSISFGSTFTPEPRDSFTGGKPGRRVSTISAEKVRSLSINSRASVRIKSSSIVNDLDASTTPSIPTPGISSLFSSVGVDPTDVATRHTNDTDQQGNTSRESEKSQQSKTSVVSHQSKASVSSQRDPGSKSSDKTKGKKNLPVNSRGASGVEVRMEKKTEGVPPTTKEGNSGVRKVHQKLIDKYQAVLGIDVAHFDGTADTFKTLIDIKQ